MGAAEEWESCRSSTTCACPHNPDKRSKVNENTCVGGPWVCTAFIAEVIVVAFSPRQADRHSPDIILTHKHMAIYKCSRRGATLAFFWSRVSNIHSPFSSRLGLLQSSCCAKYLCRYLPRCSSPASCRFVCSLVLGRNYTVVLLELLFLTETSWVWWNQWDWSIFLCSKTTAISRKL